MKSHADWNESYREGNLPWDTGHPSSELQRVVSAHAIRPGRALDIGCGTGTNSIWLAEQGFDVLGIDVAPLAVERAEHKARAVGASARFITGDILALSDRDLPASAGPFEFFFDRGCYHAVRRSEPTRYAASVAQHLAPGARGLILTGNSREPHEPGPPVVSEQELRAELGTHFEFLDLHEFRFDEAPGVRMRFLGWSCLVEKR